MNLLPREIKVDVANTLNAIGVQTPIAQQQIAHKALRNDLSAPKRKHVRKIIVDSWNYGQIDLFKQLEKEPLTKLGNVCFKAFTVIHKVLQEGAPRFLKRSHSAMGFIRHLQNHWESVSNTDIHYGKINALYGYFLRGKITFHYKHPLVLGTLSLDDYQKKIKNQPEVALFIRQQMICHLLDLQDMVLDLEEAILSFHGRDLHETKKAGLVPLVVEADALLRITVHHLTALCDRTNDIKVAKDYINRFNKHYPRLRLFFDNASRIPYVTDLVSVPVLPADPPQFLATGKLAHLVPLPDQTTNVTPLMLGEDDKRGNRSASAYAEQLARERQQQEQANQAQSQANFPSVPVGGIDQNRGSVNFPSVPLGGQGGQQGGQGGVPAANAPTGWVSFGGAAAAPKPVSTSATPVPANWVAFGAGGQPGAGQPGAGQPGAGQVGAGGQQVGQHPGGAAGQPGAGGLNAGFPSVPSGQPQFATPGQQGTSWVGFGNAGQAQQASVAGVAGVPGSPQQGTLSAQAGVATNTASALLSTEAENKYLDLIRQKDDEIAHWKGQYQNAMLLVEELQATVNEHSQRADDLEQHLQDIMQQIQQEKEARLLRKLENAVKNVQNTLGVLTNLELPSNLSSTPEQILSAYHQLLQHLDDVENAAMNRDHESLLNATKGVVVASNQQAEHCKGVAHLTDNKELSNELSNAATRATHGIQKLLETIRDNPYDADPIVADVKQVRELANLLEKATTNIIKEERVEQNPDDNLVDQATAELMRAAKIIEDAAAQLLAAKKQAEEKAKNKENKQQMEVAGTIVGGAMAITDATSLLVKYATILQKENVEAGRARGSSTLYKKDVAWSEGLISAAKSVAASVQELTVRANGCVTQETDPESLVVASKQVAAATAQLLIASRVRSDPNSTAQKNLEMASRAVTQATRTLVLAAQVEVAAEVVEEDTRESLNGLSVTEVKIREMEQQAAILRLEKQLETERIKLASMRKAQYKN